MGSINQRREGQPVAKLVYLASNRMTRVYANYNYI